MNKTVLRASASLLTLALATGIAQAQEVESVTVTGVRAAVDSALGIKKEATQIMDSIVAEDIGKLPDATVVESLQHVTGVSIIRNSYEPSTVLIRGLPDVQTLLNGRQVFSATGRTISLPDFPSELLSRVDVHKASSATDISGGIAGLIDVHLHRPFDFDGLVLAAGVSASHPTLAGNIDPNASFLISNRWHTDVGEVGLLIDASFRADHNREDDMGASSRAGTSSGPVPGAALTPGPVCTSADPTKCGTNNITYAGGIRPGYAARFSGGYDQRDGKVERAAVNISSQWRPTETVELFAEGFYSRLRNTVNSDFFVSSQNGNCFDSAKSKVYTGTNFLQEEYNGCYAGTSQQPLHSKEDTFNVAAGGSWDVTDRLTLTTEFSATRSRTTTANYTVDTFYNFNNAADSMHTINSYNGSGGTYFDMPGNEAINGPFYYNQFYDNWSDQRGSAWDGRLDGKYDFGAGSFISSLELGFRFNRRNAHNYGPSGGGLSCSALATAGNPASANNKYLVGAYTSTACTAFRAAATPSTAAVNNPLTQTNVRIGGIPIPTVAYHCTHGELFDGEFGNTKFCDLDPVWLNNNVEQIRALYGYSGRQENSPATEYRIAEENKDSYIKINYAFDVYGFPVDGNVGARYVDTTGIIDSNSSTYAPNGSLTCTTCVIYTPVHAIKENGDLLPSLNMRVTLADDLFFRFGASRTITRPTFGNLNPSYKITNGTSNTAGSISGGNPNLNPVKSTNLDADVEYYWGHGNHLNAAVFHRDVSGYIQNQTQQVFIDGNAYNQTLPINAQNAPINGVEAGYSQFLDFLPGFWSGFGWDINATYISGVFNNISPWHANTAAIYEKGPLSVRVSYTWSSSYLVGNSTGVQPNRTYAAPRSNLDASINYNLTSQFILTLDATNISNSRYRAYAHAPGGDRDYEQNIYANALSQFDRVLSLGVRYRM